MESQRVINGDAIFVTVTVSLWLLGASSDMVLFQSCGLK